MKIHSKYDPSIARLWTDYLDEIPKEWIKEHAHIYGNLTKPSMQSPIDNLEWDFLYFTDSSVFSPAANNFRRLKKETGFGQYTTAIVGTEQYSRFWKQEWDRCTNGYTIGGVFIPGEYYFYLNYCPIKKVVDKSSGREGMDFPSFNTMDYYYYLELDRLENTDDATKKQNIILAKARRKGFSFKNAAGCVWKFTFFKESKSVIATEYGDRARNTFDMATSMIDFINQNTEFRTPILIRKSSNTSGCRIMSGAKVKQGGKEYVVGRKSEILTVSLFNKPDAAAGLGAQRVIFEEAGMIKRLKEAWAFTEPTLRSGNIRKGIGIIFGTGGDMEGATRDFAEMFYSPTAYNLASYKNVYEYAESTGEAGLFVSDMWFNEGSYLQVAEKRYEAVDDNGNCRLWVAELILNGKRMAAMKGDKRSFYKLLTQSCKTPSEAFLINEGNVFPTGEIMDRLSFVRRYNLSKGYTAGKLVELDGGNIDFTPDVRQELTPMDYYPLKGRETKKDLQGAVMIYKQPEHIGGVVPAGAYIIGHDPFRVEGGVSRLTAETSLGATYVMRTNKYSKEIGAPGTIVASYIAREDNSDDYNYNLYKLAKYYNAQVMHENDVGHVKQYFQYKKSLGLLAPTPIHLVEKHTPNSNTINRKYGISMSSIKFKKEAIRYIIDWLLETRPESTETRNLDIITDEALLQEMLMFNFETGNYDRIMALSCCILFLENSELHDITFSYTQNYSFFTDNDKIFNLERLKQRNAKIHTSQGISKGENQGQLEVG
jgi:hypothetical protein